MRLTAATVSGLLLFVGSLALLAIADEAIDLTAIAGGIGVVLAGALLGLTFLAWRWSSGTGAYVVTAVDASGLYEELAATFDDDRTEEQLGDAAAV